MPFEEGLVETDTEPVHEMAAAQMIDQLRQSLHLVGQTKRGLVVFDEVGVGLGPFHQDLIQPLPDVLLLFVKHLVHALSGQKNSSSLLIEAFDDVWDLVAPRSLHRCHPCDAFPVQVFEDSLQLEIEKLFK